MTPHRVRFCVWMVASLGWGLCGSIAARAQDAEADELAAEQARAVQIAERFLGVLQQNPRRGTALDRVYGHHVEYGTLEQFLAELKQRTVDDPQDGTAWMLLGLLQAHRGEDASAVEALREAERLRPEDALASYYLGQSQLLIGQPEEAVAAFERAIERSPARADLLEIFQQLGRVHQRAQRTEQALEVWTRLETMFPDDARVLEQIAVTLVEEGEFGQALPRYEKLATLVEDDYRRVVFSIEAAQLKVRQGRRDEGLQDLERLLAELNPESWLHRDVRRRIEDVFLRSGDQDGLVTYYERWIETHADDVDAMARLARFLAASARVPEAAQWMEKALKLAPSRTELRKAFIDQLVDDQRYAEAIEQYELLVESSKDNPDFLREWGQLVLRDKEVELTTRKQRAEEIWNRMLALRPDDPVTLSQVADLFRHAEMNDQAIALYQKAVAQAPDEPQYREYLGEFFHVLKRPEEALATWGAMVEGPRRNVVNVARLAEVYNSFGYLDRAIEQIAAACALDAKDISLQLTAADYHARADKPEAALEFVAAAEALAANDEQREAVVKQRIEIYQASDRLEEEIDRLAAELAADADATADEWHVLARYLEANREWAEAMDALEKALARDENSIPALTTAARVGEQSGDFAEAAAMSRRLATVDRRSRSEHLMTVARLEAQLGRSEEALAAGREVIVSAPGNTENYEFFAQLCFQLGKPDEGLEALRKAVRINPGEPALVMALGSALANQIRTDEAIEVYWRAFEQTEEIDDLTTLTTRLTELYLQLNQFDKLVERLVRDRQEDDKRRVMTICLAQAHHASGDYGAARQELESLLSEDTHDTNLLQQLSKLCEEGADLDAAVEYQRQLVQIAPGAETEFRLANLLQSRGDRDEASEILIRLTRREEDPARLLRSVDSLLNQGNFESVIAIVDPLVSQQGDNWELLYREAVAWASLDNQPEALARLRRLLAISLPHDEQGVQAAERLKQAQARARSQNLQGFQTAAPQRQSPLTMLGMANAVRMAVGLNSQDYYAYSGTQSAWTPESFGLARMAAYGWMLRFEQDQKPVTTDEAESEPSFAEALVAAAAADGASREAIYDSLYVETLRGNMKATFAVARRLAAEGGRDEQAFYLASLQTRGVDANSQPIRSRNNQPAKEPLSEGDLALMMTCYEALSAGSESEDATAAAYGGQVAYSSDGRMYVNIGGTWVQMGMAAGGGRYLGIVLEELKLAGQQERADALLDAALAAGDSAGKLASAMQLLYAQEKFDRLPAVYEQWVKAAAAEVAKAPPPASGSRAQPARPSGMAAHTQVLVPWMGRLGAEEENAQILAILDPALDLAIQEARINRANRPRRRSTGGPVRTNYGASFTLYYGKEPIRAQLAYPAPNDYVSSPTLMLLRETFEVFQRNDVLEDLPEHLRKRVQRAKADDLLYEQLMLGYVLWWCEEQDEAVEQIAAAAAALQDDPKFRLEVASLYEALEDFDAALEAVESIAPRDQQLVQQRELAALQIAERLGDVDRARQAAERLFGMRLDNNAQLDLVGRMQRLGMHDLAEAITTRVHRRMGTQAGSLQTLMALYQGQGKTELAEQIAHTILQRSTSPLVTAGNSARNPMRYRTSNDAGRMQAIRLLQQTGALKKLIANLETQLEQSPESPRLYAQLIEFYEASGQRDKVTELLSRAAEARPDAMMFRLRLAKNYEQTGKVKEACDEYLVILKQQPTWVSDDFYSVARLFERAKRTADLARAVEEVNLRSLGQPYYVIELLETMLNARERGQEQVDMELVMNLFERAFEAFPQYRGQMISQVRSPELFKNDRIYALARRGVIPSAVEATGEPWFGVDDIYSYSSGGRVSAMLHRLLEGIRGTERVADLKQAIAAARDEAPDWHGGEAMLALVELHENQKDEAKERLTRLLDDEEVLKSMPSDACWIVGQELTDFADTRPLALRLFEHALTTPRSMNQIEYSPAAQLVKLYVGEGRREEARDMLLKQLRGVQTDMFDAQYSMYQRVENTVWAGEQLMEMGFPVDAVRLYRGVADDPTALEQAGAWYGGQPEYFKSQVENGLAAALESFDKLNAADAMAELLKPAEDAAEGAPALDLMVSAPEAKSFRTQPLKSPLVELLLSLSKQEAVRAALDAQLAELAAKHPSDLSVAIAGAAYRVETGHEEAAPSLKRLQTLLSDHPLEEIAEGRRPNSRQRREALPLIPVWLVARKCLADETHRAAGEELAAAALAAAQRQANTAYAAAMLYEWGNQALAAGDRAGAEAKWTELLDIVTKRPERKSPTAAGPGGAPAAVPVPRPAAPPAAAQGSLWWSALLPTALLAAEEVEEEGAAAAAESVAPLTISQFQSTIEIALAAAENDMPALSRKAVRASLAGGAPAPDAAAGPAGPTVVGGVVRMVASSPYGLSASGDEAAGDKFEDQVASSLKQVLAKWRGNAAYPAEDVYALLAPIVFPAARPTEILLYADSTQLRDARVSSLGAELVEWAASADRLDDLAAKIAERRTNTPALVPALVLETLAGMAEADRDAAAKSLAELAANVEKGMLPQMVRLACHAAIPAAEIAELQESAHKILQAAVNLEVQQADPNLNNDESMGRLARLVNRRLGDDEDAIKKFYEAYISARQPIYSRYSGDYGQYMQLRDWAFVAQEAALVGAGKLTLDFMGRVTDVDYSQYGRPSLTLPLAVACRKIKLLAPQQQYETWRDWTLPVEGRQTVRIAGDWIEPVKFPQVFLEENPEAHAIHRADYLCNLVELVNAAEAAGTLDDLRQRVEPLHREKVPGAVFLWAMVLVRAGDFDAARPIVAELMSTLAERRTSQPNQPQPDPWGDFAVFRACLETPGAGDLYDVADTRALLMTTRRGNDPLNGVQVRLRPDHRFWDVGEGEAAHRDAVQLTHWVAASTRHLTSGLEPWWVVHEGHIAHLRGPEFDTLCYKYPLTGDFQFTVEAADGFWSEGEAGYGVMVQAHGSGSDDDVVSISGHETVPIPAALHRETESFNRIDIDVADGRMRHRVNHHLIYEEDANRTSPWLVLSTIGPRILTFRNLAITGNPVIPREVALLDGDSMEGWCTQMFSETQPSQRVMAAKPKAPDDRIAHLQSQEPKSYDWRTEDGVLLGEPKPDDASNLQSWIYYFRPLHDGETFKYEFYYVPGQTVAHPTIGRLALLLEPEGVNLHWIGRRDWDDPVFGIDEDNVASEPANRRGPEELPLKENDWNQVEVTLAGSTAQVSVNGQLAYEQPLDPQNDRVVGFYRLKSQATKVRGAVLTGPWPEQFDEELRNGLLATSAVAPPDVQRRIHAILTDQFHLHDVEAVVRRARELPDEEAFEELKRWVLPSDDHANIRLYFRQRGAADAESEAPLELASPALSLIEMSARLGKLPEIRDAIDAARADDPTSTRNKAAFLALVAMTAGDWAVARERLAELDRALAEGLPKDLLQWDRSAEYVAAFEAAQHAELHAAAEGLVQRLVDQLQLEGEEPPTVNAQWRSDVAALRGAVRYALARQEADAQAGAALTQWHSVTHSTPELLSYGNRPSQWRFSAGAVEHVPAGLASRLYFQSPLVGEFEITAQRPAAKGGDILLAYGAGAEMLDEEDPFSEPTPRGEQASSEKTSDVLLSVKGGKVVASVDGAVVEEHAYGAAADPWLSLRAATLDSLGAVRNLRIVGAPQIPDELNLSEITAPASWRTDRYKERLATSDDDEDAPWRRTGDEILGQLRTDRSARPLESLLAYHRPMLEDGVIEFEAFYLPGEFEVHPAVGRTAILVGKGGVRRHTLTGGPWETSELTPDNEQPIEGAGEPQLKENDWNRYRIEVAGDRLTLSVNDKAIAECSLADAPAERFFGFFRYADQTKCRVRNIVYRGEWPKELPPVTGQELASPDDAAAAAGAGEPTEDASAG